LWLVFITGYVPRRVARLMLRRLRAPGPSAAPPATTFVLDLLIPSRIERRLGAEPGRRAPDARYGTGS
jgi:hypothetical protein